VRKDTEFFTYVCFIVAIRKWLFVVVVFVFSEWGSLGVVLIEECDLQLKNHHREGRKTNPRMSAPSTYVKNKVVNKIKIDWFYDLRSF